MRMDDEQPRSVAGPGADGNDWPEVLHYWRSLPAEMFDDVARQRVIECVERISSTIPEWRQAIAGDAAAAIGLAFRLGAPSSISVRVDLVMTALLRCAFENPAAALALSYAIRKMPLARRRRGRIAASWLVHNFFLGRRSYGRRSIPSNLLQGRKER
jgi:hypothetical protein